MIFPFLRSRPFWDRVEIICAVLGGACSGLTATQTQDFKRIPASLAFVFASFVAFAKWQSKKIEEKEKVVKSESERIDRERREDEGRRLLEESNAERQSREGELARIRQEHVSAVKEMVGVILEDLRSKYFRRETADEKHKHRVTLFKCVEIDGDSGKEKRLMIFARAGVHQDSGCSWPLDDNDPDKCRGIAAQIWFHGVGTVKTAICDWPPNGDAIEKARYADSIGISVDEAAALNIKSRTFAGARIIAKDRKWGVLLLDSLKEDHIKDADYEKRLLNGCANLISSVINRMAS